MATRELTTSTERVAWAISQVKANGVGLTELAEKMGCSHATLSQWQNGATQIENAKVGLIDAFCRETGISLHWLLHGGPIRVDNYTPSEMITNLVTKLAAMEAINPDGLSMVARMIDAAVTPEGAKPS